MQALGICISHFKLLNQSFPDRQLSFAERISPILLLSFRLVEQSYPHTDQYLLELLAEDNEAAFRSLYQRYAARVLSLAMQYLKSPVSAQDAVQEIFLKVWTMRKELPRVDNFSAWLITVTRNRLIDELRRQARQHNLPAGAMDEPSTTPEWLPETKQVGAIIHAAVRSLPQRQQQVYLLAREQGLTHRQIAEHLGLSVATVKEHMKQALKNIRAFVQKGLGLH